MPTKKKRKLSKWNKLFGAKLKYCAGTGTEAQLERAAAAYIKDAKDPKKAKRSADKLINSACRVR